MNYKLNLIILSAVILALSGCATTVRTYPGEPLPPEKVAILKGACNEYIVTAVCAYIQKVDDQRAAGDKVEVLPGKHDVKVYLALHGIMTIVGKPRTFSINTEAGHTYIIDGTWSKSNNQIWIVDKQTGAIIVGDKLK